jgi:hypothetical protein
MKDTSTMEQGEGCGEKFTPGPWKVFTSPHGLKIGIGRETTGEGVADCGFGLWGGDSPEAFANARLIASAPELYEAAKLALATAESWIHDQLDGTGMVDEALAKLEPVRAALLKASGGKDV